MWVRCNNCMEVFDEKEIVYDANEDEELCPKCGIGGCLMDLPTSTNPTRLCEAVFDIAMVMANLLHENRIHIEDSREAYATVLNMAQRFEAQFDEGQDDYMLAIEEFVKRELLSRYPTACAEQTMIKFDDGRLYHAPTTMFTKERKSE